MSIFKKIQKIIAIVLLVVGLFFLTKYGLLKWGSLKVETDSTITVRGTYTMQVQNQVASYNVGFNSTNTNREDAVKSVNERSEKFVEMMKEYGIDSNDLQTTNKNVYQREEPYYEDGVQKFKKTDWTASSTISVVLRDIAKVDDFSAKVYSLDASDLNGPYFSLDYNTDNDIKILKKAMESVEEKAKILANENGKILGEVISINEDDSIGSAVPVMERGMGGGGGSSAGNQAGSSTVTKSVTVTYKIY